MDGPHITSASNPRVKASAALQKRRERQRSGRFLIEGKREVSRAIAGGIGLETVFVAAELAGDPAPIVEELPGGTELISLGTTAFKPLSRRQNPDGVAAVAITPSHDLADIGVDGPTLLLVVEQVEKPGNLGAMLRSADGAGAAVIAADPDTDFENPNVIRASQGSVFTLPVAAASASEVMAWLGAADVEPVALVPDGDHPTVWDVDLGERVALIVGSESEGLSEHIRSSARLATIPMRGTADSLNVSVAAAIALYEAVRQRSAR